RLTADLRRTRRRLSDLEAKLSEPVVNRPGESGDSLI
ncbi:hypothetical protein AP02_04088, partial [Mycobacterium tuberculosis M2352]